MILPTILPALLTGFALAFARGLGEYGSVIFIAGNMPMVSEIVPLLIVIKLSSTTTPAPRSGTAMPPLPAPARDQPAAALDARKGPDAEDLPMLASAACIEAAWRRRIAPRSARF